MKLKTGGNANTVRDACPGAHAGEDLCARTILEHRAKAADGIAVVERTAVPIVNQRAFVGA
jgi:hypothetical protein